MPRKPGNLASLDRLTSEPLLNDEQRAALDAALAKKSNTQDSPVTLNGVPPTATFNPGSFKPHPGKNIHNEGTKTKRDLAHDHHLSRRGKGTSRAKKSGAGGRFTWGALIDPADTEGAHPAADRGDPNWDSEEDEAGLAFAEERSTQIIAYKAAISTLLQEYFSSGDLNEAAVSLQELDHPQFGHYFVKKAITTAMDRHDAEREMTSILLSTLYNEIISPEEMKRGFSEAIASIDDLSLDVPDASDQLALFICRAVADDALPPAFVHKLDDGSSSFSSSPSSSECSLRIKCEAHLADSHFAERMSRCWGHGAGVKLEETKASIAAMLAEYLSSGDVGEVRRLLHDLSVPFFHHELVKKALMAGSESTTQMDSVLTLLGQLAESMDISTSQMTKGFQRVADSLEDIELDNPGASTAFAHAIDIATKESWLEESWKPVPTPGSIPGTPSHLWANGHGPFHPSVKAFKESSLDITAEYFESGDIDEVARRLVELDEPGFMNIFIKHTVQLSMDRRDREREMISTLLPHLCPDIISSDQISLGFTRLLASADDLTLDIPDAAHLLTFFLGRAIVDEVLPPKFLVDVVPSLNSGSLGVYVVQATGAMLSARHAAERFLTCWHARDTAPGTKALSMSMSELLREYMKNPGEQSTKSEAAQCLRDLNSPHFHHELVYLAVIAALEDGEGEKSPALELLKELCLSGEVSQTQLKIGFDRIKAEIDDLVLDYVNALDLVGKIEERAVADGWWTGVS